MRAAAITDLILLLGAAVALADAEAAAVGLGFVIGLVLLRRRKGLTGRLVLLLLFVDVLGWMMLGTITNIAGGEPLLAVATPAALSVTSITGAIATVAAWRGGRNGRGPLVVAGVAAGLWVLALLAGLITSDTDVVADVQVQSENVLFTPTSLQVGSGPVTVELANSDLFWHTFTIDELDVDLAVPVSGSRQTTFDAPPGTYRFYCRIPGHESRMAGTLTVN